MRSLWNCGGEAAHRKRLFVLAGYLALIIVLGSGAAQAQLLTMTTSAVPAPPGPPALVNTVHNYAPSPVTAWIVGVKFKKPGLLAGGYTFSDSLTSHVREISPGGGSRVSPSHSGDPNDFDFRLVAAVFADGSTFGDPQWARALILRRKKAYQIFEGLLSDLSAIRDMSSAAEMRQYLDTTRQRHLSEATTNRNASNATANLRTTDGSSRDIFEEKTSELKVANARTAADNEGVNLVSSYYNQVLAVIDDSRPSLPSLDIRLQGLIRDYSDMIGRLTESKPSLAAVEDSTIQ
jgi:hypothetical protein